MHCAMRGDAACNGAGLVPRTQFRSRAPRPIGVQVGGREFARREPRRGGLAFAAIFLLALALGVGPASAATKIIRTAVVSAGSQKSAPPMAAPPPTPLASVISQLGEAPAYSSDFGGYVENPDGSFSVYTAAADPAPLAQAITQTAAADDAAPTAAGPASTAVKVVHVSHSYAALETLAQQIGAAAPGLRATSGITIAMDGPDVSTNTVLIDLNDYSQSAADALVKRFGGAGWVSVEPTPSAYQSLPDGGMQPLSNRYYDTSPWYNGDRISINGDNSNKCTDGWALKGLNSGRTFNLTAGHCFGSSFYNNGHLIGSLSTQYWPGTMYDMESISCSACSTNGATWTEGPSIGTGQGTTKIVNNYATFPAQQLVAFDGASTGEVDNNRVVSAEAECIPAYASLDNLERCGMYNTVSQSGATACQPGDSGGPVFQNEGNGYVTAAGIVVSKDVGNNTTTCWYLGIKFILDETVTALY
jgi:hypothetical protein